MKQIYTVTGIFRDKNQPSIIETAEQYRVATMYAWHIGQQFAGLKAISIRHPDGTIDLHTSSGKHLFTLPPLTTPA